MPLKPNHWPRNSRESRTVTAAAHKCSATSCPSCWHAWGSAWYNRPSQGSRPPPHQLRDPRTPFDPKGKPQEKLDALSDHQRLIRHRGVAPLIYQYGDKVITPRERQAREATRGALRTHL